MALDHAALERFSIKKQGCYPPASRVRQPVNQAVLEAFVSMADMVAARAMHPATGRKPIGNVVLDEANFFVEAPLCLLYPRQKKEMLDSVGACVISPSRPVMAAHGSQHQR